MRDVVWPLYFLAAATMIFMMGEPYREKHTLQTAKQQCAEMIKQHQEASK